MIAGDRRRSRIADRRSVADDRTRLSDLNALKMGNVKSTEKMIYLTIYI